MLERGRRAAWVPQDVQFEFGFSVHAVVGQGRFAHGDDAAGVDAALASLDLSGLATRAVNQLSGGERERVLLARALVTDAPLQLWDEPLAALDPRHALKVLALARQRAQEGATVLLSLHDLRLAHSLDSIVILHRGRLRAFGAPEDVFESNLLREVFGVETRMEPGLTFSL
jgi:iron complex transport system ATP-binding protein